MSFIIRKSGLSGTQQKEFLSALENLTENDLRSFLEVVNEDNSLVEKFYHNYQSKKKAFVNSDLESLRNIIKEEEEMLRKV